MTYALSVHLQIDTTVIDPIAIVSLNLMALHPETAHGPGTAQHSSHHFNLLPDTGVSRFVYTLYLANWTTAVLKIEHLVLSPALLIHTDVNTLLNVTFITCQPPQPFC